MYRAARYGDYVLKAGGYKPQLITTAQKHKDDNTAFVQKTWLEYNNSWTNVYNKQ
jgi:hypothetical protein